MKIKIKHDSLFGVPEVAIIFGVSEATVRKWVKDRKLILAHAVSYQNGFLIRGNEMRYLLKDNPRYSWPDDTYEIPEEFKTEYLLAAKDRCLRELSAAQTAMKTNMVQLNQIMNELFKEEG